MLYLLNIDKNKKMKGYIIKCDDIGAYIFNWILILLGIINFIISINSIKSLKIKLPLIIIFAYCVA